MVGSVYPPTSIANSLKVIVREHLPKFVLLDRLVRVLQAQVSDRHSCSEHPDSFKEPCASGLRKSDSLLLCVHVHLSLTAPA